MVRDLPFEVPTEPFLAKAAADRAAAAAAAAARNNQGFITLITLSCKFIFHHTRQSKFTSRKLRESHFGIRRDLLEREVIGLSGNCIILLA